MDTRHGDQVLTAIVPNARDLAPRVLVTGATGYIGGRLAPSLLDAGYQVRCIARNRAKLLARPWAADPRVEVVEADASE